MNSAELDHLTQRLKQSIGILHKQDIQGIAKLLSPVHFPKRTVLSAHSILLGDDCAAIPDGEGYLLLACEGMMPFLMESDPWFAGWSAVMVNISDIYAMGGRAIAIVDTLWSTTTELNPLLLAGMQAAAQAYQVPIVGGHTNGHSPYNALAVSILGRAQRLISSFQAQPGDRLLVVLDLRGTMHPQYPFWNAATTADPFCLRADLALLPQLAEQGLCDAGKDISMGGIIGTVLMLLETSGVGATLNLEAVPQPKHIAQEQWLVSFPSYGFLLSVRPEKATLVSQKFGDRGLICTDIGEIQDHCQLILQQSNNSTVFWDFNLDALTGFTPLNRP